MRSILLVALITLALLVCSSHSLWDGLFDPKTYGIGTKTMASAQMHPPNKAVSILYSLAEKIILSLYSEFLPYSSGICSLGYSLVSFFTNRKNVLIFVTIRVIYFSLRFIMSYYHDIKRNSRENAGGIHSTKFIPSILNKFF